MRRRKVSFSSDPRWMALKRAGLAVAVAVALLLAMLWFGDDDQLPSPEPASDALAQHDAPAPENDADAPALLASDAVADTAAQTEAAQTEAAQTSGEPAEPAGSVAGGNEQMPGEIPAVSGGVGAASTNTATLPEPVADAPPKSPTQKAADAPPKSLAQKAASAPAKPTRAVDTPAPSAALQDGYFIQLGVFDDTDKSRKLFENVGALGLPVHIQSRVVVGPFRNKREAEAARDRLKGVAEGTVLPPQNLAKANENPKAKLKLRRRAK